MTFLSIAGIEISKELFFAACIIDTVILLITMRRDIPVVKEFAVFFAMFCYALIPFAVVGVVS